MALIVFLMIMIMNGAAESKIKKVYTTEKDPCPNCADWCRSDPDYTCNYSCDDEGHEDIFNVNCDEKTENIKCIHFARTYPLCNFHFNPYDVGAERCCKAAANCYDKQNLRHRQISDKCDPEVPTDVYPPMLDMVVLDRVTTMTWNYIVTSGKDRHKKFFDWCGLQCINGRFAPIKTTPPLTLHPTKKLTFATTTTTRKSSTTKFTKRSTTPKTKVVKSSAISQVIAGKYGINFAFVALLIMKVII
ncbi:hypothetical protein ACQ4LE_004502 [Meloidogyne hapla]